MHLQIPMALWVDGAAGGGILFSLDFKTIFIACWYRTLEYIFKKYIENTYISLIFVSKSSSMSEYSCRTWSKGFVETSILTEAGGT